MDPTEALVFGMNVPSELLTSAGRIHLCAFRLADGGFEPKATPSANSSKPRRATEKDWTPSIQIPLSPQAFSRQGPSIHPDGSEVDSGLASPRTQAASAIGGPGQAPLHPGIPLQAVQAIGLGVGQYTKVRVVGRGTQGQVWQVTSQDGTYYALKEIALKGVLWHRDFPKRLRDADREVRALKGLSWASSVIVPIVDCWISKDFELSCLVMQWMPKNLSAVLNKLSSEIGGAVPCDVARNWLARLVAGLGAVHAAGFIHRDIKPSNILLDETLTQCKITDLGVSRALHRQSTKEVESARSAVGAAAGSSASRSDREATEEKYSMVSENMGSILSGYTVRPGTIAYTSPEACESCHYGCQADMFSLGVVALEVLTLQRPPEPGLGEVLPANHTMEFAKEKFASAPRTGSESSEWAELTRLCIWMLRPRPEDRPVAKDLANNPHLLPHIEQLARDTPKLRVLLLQNLER